MQMPPVTQNLILINALCWLASLVLPRFGIDLIELGGLHFPGTHTFHWFQPLTYMFLHDTHSIGTFSSTCSPSSCLGACWR